MLDVADHIDAVNRAEFGATVTFLGHVRNHDPAASGEVTAVEYTAHPDAVQVLERLCASLGPECAVAVSHRIGVLGVGQVALVACVASAHRAAAYEASRRLIESIKAELPVWKRQVEADGRTTWVGL